VLDLTINQLDDENMSVLTPSTAAATKTTTTLTTAAATTATTTMLDLTLNQAEETTNIRLTLYQNTLYGLPDFIRNMPTRQSYEARSSVSLSENERKQQLMTARSTVSLSENEKQQLITFLLSMKELDGTFKRHIDDERLIFDELKSFSSLIPRSLIPRSCRGTLSIRENWLNEDIINEYGRLLSQRPSMKTRLILATHVYPKLVVYKNYPDFAGANTRREGLSTWLDVIVQTMAFETSELIFFPCNISATHWIVITLSLTKKEVYGFNSMDSIDDLLMIQNIAKTYLIPFCKVILRRRAANINLDEGGEWQYYTVACPQQLNCVDCGVFVCMFMDFASDDIDPQCLSKSSFCRDESSERPNNSMLQANIDYFRLKIAIDIIRGDLGY
jgi:hypothetical protein